MVDRLCRLEFVERLESKTDKRAVDVRITKKGLKLLDKLSDKVDDFESPLRVLSKKESELLNTTLDKILGKFIEKK